MSPPPDDPLPSRFLAELSHELRTPLGAILGFADAMRGRAFGPLSDQYAEHAGLIHDAGRHLLELVDVMTKIAQAESGAGRRPFETFDACAEVREVADLLSGKLANAHIDFDVRFGREPLAITADRLAIRQILINLLDNALAATGRGGTVGVSLVVDKADLLLRVFDTGAELLPPRESRIDDKRTGLGLTLVDSLCRLHGGSFALRTDPSEGATAVARLPVIAQA